MITSVCRDSYFLDMDMEQLRNCVGTNETQNGNQVVNSSKEPAEELIKEIAVLEMEVAYLEKCLLSMYRERFSLATPSDIDGRHEFMFSEVKRESKEILPNNSVPFLAKEFDEIVGATKLDDSSILRCHSSLSHAACSFRTTSSTIGAIDSYHSLPMSLQESNSNLDDLCPIVSDQVQGSPNWLSEEMIKCISAIYCKLANKWSDNHFHVEESVESIGPFVTAVELRGLYRDDQSLNRVHHLLQRFRYLVLQMEQIDPRKMKHEEKLAFWINVHNALVMHAFLVYGIPRSNLKRVSLLLKAAYNIGGKAVSVEMIQSCILGCQLPRPGQWLQMLFFPKNKFKSNDQRRAYAIEHQEPRLRFALCSGSHSDPVVRLYTPKRMFQDLEVAKEEYMQTNIRVHKEQKLIMPKNIECFVKDVGLCSFGLLEMIDQSLPEKSRKKFQQTDNNGKLWKKIEWIPHNFSFRFLISNELADGMLSV